MDGQRTYLGGVSMMNKIDEFDLDMDTATIKVEVTQYHIDEGAPYLGENCALALAYQEAGFRMPAVSIRWMYHGPLENRRAVRMPEAAIQFRDDYDNKGKNSVEPFAFEQSLIPTRGVLGNGTEPDHG